MQLTLFWLYPLGIYFHFARNQQDHIYVPILAVTLAFFFSRWYRAAHTIFLCLSSVFLLTRWPEVANHVFIILVMNTALLYIKFREYLDRNTQHTDSSLRWFLFWLLFIVYFWAGFHKINFDFLFTPSSCALDYAHKIWPDLHHWNIPTLVKSLPWLIVFLEILGGLCLLFPYTRSISLFLLLTLHVSLAKIGFADFSMLATSLLFGTLVIPTPKAEVQLKNYLLVLFVLALSIGLVAAGMMAFPYPGSSTWVDISLGFMTTLSLFLIGIYLFRYQKNSGLSFNMQAVFCKPPSHFLTGLLIFVFFWGATPYLGLGTRSNFSMFSNLHTEEGFENHLLLKKTFLKLSDLQEDIFWIKSINISPDLWSFSRDYIPGEGINAVELRKILRKIRVVHPSPISAQYDFKGQSYSTNDIYTDPLVQFEESHIEDYLFGFKFVPVSKPYRCQW